MGRPRFRNLHMVIIISILEILVMASSTWNKNNKGTNLFCTCYIWSLARMMVKKKGSDRN